MSENDVLVASLRRWADARDRRYNQDHPHGAHGKTGTNRLREAANVIEDLSAPTMSDELREIADEQAAQDANFG